MNVENALLIGALQANGGIPKECDRPGVEGSRRFILTPDGAYCPYENREPTCVGCVIYAATTAKLSVPIDSLRARAGIQAQNSTPLPNGSGCSI